jgi:hypothetical protein
MPADADDADETWLVSPSRAAAAALEQRRKGFEAYVGELVSRAESCGQIGFGVRCDRNVSFSQANRAA